jgi:hypothetical protein
MKKPYIKKIYEKNGNNFFYVDGAWIRENIDEEFITYSDHLKFKFIPPREVWIEEEFSKKEWKYYVKYFVAKLKYLGECYEYWEAVRLANVVEQNARNKNPTVKKLKKLPRYEQVKAIHKKLLKKYSNDKVKVWMANGFLVRSLYYLDYCAGGHDKVYHFVPRGEIWIDDAINPKDFKCTLIHEAHERRLMAKGMTYDKAHHRSSRLELSCRKHPRKIDRVLRRELRKQK